MFVQGASVQQQGAPLCLLEVRPCLHRFQKRYPHGSASFFLGTEESYIYQGIFCFPSCNWYAITAYWKVECFLFLLYFLLVCN